MTTPCDKIPASHRDEYADQHAGTEIGQLFGLLPFGQRASLVFRWNLAGPCYRPDFSLFGFASLILGWRIFHQLSNTRNQPIGVMMKIDTRIENERVAKGQTLEIGREILHLWHRRIIDQYRNNRDPALQGSGDFESNKIRGVVDPAIAPTATAEPSRTDDCDNNSGAFQCLLDLFPKVHAVRDGIEVHKDISLTEIGLQAIVETTGDRCRVLSAIRNRDHWRVK